MIPALVLLVAASAAPTCDSISKATEQSYAALWRYEAAPASQARLTAALEQGSKPFADLGVDMRADVQSCDEHTRLPYEMLAAYWYEQQSAVEPHTQALVGEMTQRLRSLHQALSPSNLFLAQFTRDVVAEYKRVGQALPPDVQAWAADSRIAADAQCRMPYYQDAAIASWTAPAYPASAAAAGLGSELPYVELTIGADGRASGARVVATSGNGSIDRAARDAARNSRYYAKTIFCEPVAATYVLRIDFERSKTAEAALMRATP